MKAEAREESGFYIGRPYGHDDVSYNPFALPSVKI
jgi:hypothetical protein